VAITLPGFGENPHQIIHIDGMCNECGNCGTFCPHNGDPYRDKLTVFQNAEDFADSTNVGFLSLGGGKVRVRAEDGKIYEHTQGDGQLSKKLEVAVAAIQREICHEINW
jgi:putative selenate reductase